MNAKKVAALVAAAVVLVAAIVAALFYTHVLGNSPAQTVMHEGGVWDTGASAGRAWSRYTHPTEWHYAAVKGSEEAKSECVAPGAPARVTVPQSRIGRNSFDAGFCQPGT